MCGRSANRTGLANRYRRVYQAASEDETTMFCKSATSYLYMSLDRQLVEWNGACVEAA